MPLGRGTLNSVHKSMHDKMGKKQVQKGTKSYSAKLAVKGKDLGKPGKNFSKIAAKASKKYGSKKAGARVAGAILRNLRKNHA